MTENFPIETVVSQLVHHEKLAKKELLLKSSELFKSRV